MISNHFHFTLSEFIDFNEVMHRDVHERPVILVPPLSNGVARCVVRSRSENLEVLDSSYHNINLQTFIEEIFIFLSLEHELIHVA